MLNSIISVLALAAAANAATHSVDVGEEGIKFEPDSITAAVGDTIVFEFYSESGPHSVTQSSFESPCLPLDGGFFSDYIMGNDDGDDSKFTITVNSTDPIWFYCSLNKHCQNGMSGVINPPPSGDSLSSYKNSAKNVAAASAPASAQGGVVATGLESGSGSGSSTSTSAEDNTSKTDDDDTMTSMTSASTTASSASTTASSGSSGTSVVPTATSTTGSNTASATDAAASSSGTAAATTTNAASGMNSQTPVVIGLAFIVGGLVALIA